MMIGISRLDVRAAVIALAGVTCLVVALAGAGFARGEDSGRRVASPQEIVERLGRAARLAAELGSITDNVEAIAGVPRMRAERNHERERLFGPGLVEVLLFGDDWGNPTRFSSISRPRHNGEISRGSPRMDSASRFERLTIQLDPSSYCLMEDDIARLHPFTSGIKGASNNRDWEQDQPPGPWEYRSRGFGLTYPGRGITVLLDFTWGLGTSPCFSSVYISDSRRGPI